MSERELNRIEVLGQLIRGRMTAANAATLLGLSRRQVQRLRKVIETEGAAAIRHKARGRISNNRIDLGVRDYAVALVRERYADFGPTLAAEKLAEQHDLRVSRETLRRCPLGHASHTLSGNRCKLMVFGCRASNGGPFTSLDYGVRLWAS